jgi:hypothetical protein
MTKLNRDEMYNISEALKHALVADGEDIQSARVVRAEGDTMEQLVVLELSYNDGLTMEVSFYVIFDGSWFSTYDWQGWQPERKSEVPDAEWQLGVTGRKAVILGGAPRMLYEE